ncbi:hypothetical protein M8494_35990 [Serratia ureilytica]
MTLLPLLSLPQLMPPPQPREHTRCARWRAASPPVPEQGDRHGWRDGALLTMASAVRAGRAMAEGWHRRCPPGYMYARSAARRAIGAFTSGARRTRRPGWVMLLTAIAALPPPLACSAWMPWYSLALLCLVAFGYLERAELAAAIRPDQSLTPDNFLGRINGLWTAQNVVGDALGALLLEAIGAFMLPAMSASGFGLARRCSASAAVRRMTGLRQVDVAQTGAAARHRKVVERVKTTLWDQ